MLWTIFGEELHGDTEVMGKYAPDLQKRPFYRALSKYHWVPLVVVGCRCWPSGACRGCCGASSCAWSSACTAPG